MGCPPARWRRQIRTDGKDYRFGMLQSEEAAGRAYGKAVLTLRGEFTWVNFPSELHQQAIQTDAE